MLFAEIMKRIAAILFSLLIAAAPVLAMAPAAMASPDADCGGCACEAMACCAEESVPSPQDQPAAPASGSSQYNLERAALLGCSVITGVGSVMNASQVRPGRTVAVFGTGGVGVNVVQGAVLAGAEKIIAVDLIVYSDVGLDQA